MAASIKLSFWPLDDQGAEFKKKNTLLTKAKLILIINLQYLTHA